MNQSYILGYLEAWPLAIGGKSGVIWDVAIGGEQRGDLGCRRSPVANATGSNCVGLRPAILKDQNTKWYQSAFFVSLLSLARKGRWREYTGGLAPGRLNNQRKNGGQARAVRFCRASPLFLDQTRARLKLREMKGKHRRARAVPLSFFGASEHRRARDVPLPFLIRQSTEGLRPSA